MECSRNMLSAVGASEGDPEGHRFVRNARFEQELLDSKAGISPLRWTRKQLWRKQFLTPLT